MPKVMPVEANGQVTGYMVLCPACECGHLFNTLHGDGKPVWHYNGDAEKPTFRASMLVKSGHYCGAHKPGDECWCTYEKRYGKPAPYACSLCHSYITDGKIEFLGDSTHKLAGQTVDLTDFDTLTVARP